LSGWRFALFIFHFSLFLAASAASAQTAPSILIEPWPEQPLIAQTLDEVMLIDSGDVDRGGGDAGVFAWDSHGRVKFDREQREPNAVVGYRFLSVTVDADRGDLNGVYNDLAVVGGFQLGRWDDWKVGLIAGAGSANDNHWREGDAFYGIGALHVSRELSPGEQLHAGVSYDGNRSFLPDVPLPYVSYVNATDRNLVWVLGVPASSVTWRPGEAWTLNVRYTVPVDVAASVSYALTPKLSLFAQYEKKLDSFHEHDAAREDYRIFYERSIASVGVRYAHSLADVSLGVGYAFKQEFSRGWDVRDADNFADIDGAPLLMLSVRGTF